MKKFLTTGLLMVFVSPTIVFAEEDPNTKILKDAVVGAVTGAVATEATKDEKTASTVTTADTATDVSGKKKKHAHKNFTKKSRKDKKRPHGWDMGKKTGWGDGDTPPGLRDT